MERLCGKPDGDTMNSARRDAEVLSADTSSASIRAPVSVTQERLWLVERLGFAGSAYNLHTSFELRGPLNVAALRGAFSALVDRHDALRARFNDSGGTVVQLIDRTEPFELDLVDLSELPLKEREVAVKARILSTGRNRFELRTGRLFRAELLRLTPKAHVLLMAVHHIVCDRWSLQILSKEMSALYRAFSEGKPSPLPELPLSYPDYLRSHRDWVAPDYYARQVAYWKRHLCDIPQLLDLPGDRPRPPIQSMHGAIEPVRMPTKILSQARELCARERITLFMLLLGIFQIVLARWSGQCDICVGTPVSGRRRPEVEALVGMFVNTLVVRSKVAGSRPFLEFLKDLRRVAVSAYAHPDVPFDALVSELQPRRDRSFQPLFQVLFAFHNFPASTPVIPGLSITERPYDHSASQFDLSLHIEQGPSGLTGYCEYSTDLFNGATIRRLIVHFENLLAAALSAPDSRLAALSMMAPHERGERRQVQMRPLVAAAPDLGQVFDRQAYRTPHATAVLAEGAACTYQELERRSSALAERLIELGAGPEARIGICIPGSIGIVVAVLAVLKAGAACVPVYVERLAFDVLSIVKELEIKVFLAEESTCSRLRNAGVQTICLDYETWNGVAMPPGDATPESIQPNDLAFIARTSGTVGSPKAVSITRRGLSNLLQALIDEPGIKATDTMIVSAPLTCVRSLAELLAPLLVGARVALSAAVATDPAGFLRSMNHFHPDVLQSTPALLQSLLDSGWKPEGHLRVWCTGDELPEDLARALLPSAAELWSLYGLTETTGYCAACKVVEPTSVHLGQPLSHVQMYLLDPDGQPPPIGIAGEIYISGEGLARGYTNRHEQEPRFVWREQKRMFRTGDFARYRDDGAMEFLGREDRRITTGGLRTWLGEVESCIRRHPCVSQCVLSSASDQEVTSLAAFIVLRPGQPPGEPADLQEWLQDRLPAFRRPARFIALDALPLKADGKVDHDALRALASTGAGMLSPPVPASSIEERLITIWRDLLQVEQIDAENDFFALGGTSLLVVRATQMIGEEFGIGIEPALIFSAPTVAALAAQIGALSAFDAASTAQL